ncbi:hypothetical protein D3C78_1588580 [compost metagenome]
MANAVCDADCGILMAGQACVDALAHVAGHLRGDVLKELFDGVKVVVEGPAGDACDADHVVDLHGHAALGECAARGVLNAFARVCRTPGRFWKLYCFRGHRQIQPCLQVV